MIDQHLRDELDPGPLPAHEREQLWAAIEARLGPTPQAEVNQRARPSDSPRRRWRLALVPVAAGLAATLAVALLPGGERPGPDLQSASAAEVLRIAAANVGLGAPGADEVLVAVQRRTIPFGDGQTEVETTRSTAATDGAGSLGDQTFRAGEPTVGKVDLFDDWRGAIDTAELPSLPTAPDALLRDLRDRTQAALPRGDRDIIRLLGPDLAVVAVAQSLIIRAPITAEQRAALFELLATAPEWQLPGTAATPLRVERGRTDAGAVTIRIASRLTPAEQRAASTDAEWKLEFVVDPEAGEIVALREFEDPDAPPQVTTTTRQEIVAAR